MTKNDFLSEVNRRLEWNKIRIDDPDLEKLFLRGAGLSSQVERHVAPGELLGKLAALGHSAECDSLDTRKRAPVQKHSLMSSVRPPNSVDDMIGNEKHSLHDQMFNNRRKVAFESALAAVFFKTPEFFDDVMKPTIRNLRAIVMPALRRVVANKASAAESALFNCFSKDANVLYAYHAYINGKTGQFPLTERAQSPVNEITKFVHYFDSHVFGKLDDSKTFEEKLTAIYNFADFMTRSHKFHSAGKNLEPEDINFVNIRTSLEMRRLWKRYKVHDGQPGLFGAGPEYASVSRYNRQGSPQGNPLSLDKNNSSRYAGIWPVQGTRWGVPANPHEKLVAELLHPPFYSTTGVGLWRPGRAPGSKDMDPSDFAHEAMFTLDMPLVAGASGGMGSYMLTFICVGKLSTQMDLQKAFFAAYSVIIGKGYHSFHEVATVAKLLGVKYVPGKYMSAIPAEWAFLHQGLRELLKRFHDISTDDGRPPAGSVQAALALLGNGDRFLYSYRDVVYESLKALGVPGELASGINNKSVNEAFIISKLLQREEYKAAEVLVRKWWSGTVSDPAGEQAVADVLSYIDKKLS